MILVNMQELLREAVRAKASDIHITVGVPPVLRINGILRYYSDSILTSEDTENCKDQILNKTQQEQLEKYGEWDLSFSLQGVARFRVTLQAAGKLCTSNPGSRINPPTLDGWAFQTVLRTGNEA